MTKLLNHVGNDQLINRLSKTLAAGIQIPENDVFLVGMAIFSSVAARKYSVAYEHGLKTVPVGLYVVAEQPPGAAKTWLQGEFEKPFELVDNDRRKLHKETLERLENQLDDCEDKDEKKELSKQIKELQKNPIPLLFITNTTPEALEMSLHKTNGFFSLVSSEQTLFDSLFGLIGGDTGRQNNNEVVLNGFDAGKSGTLRINREAYSGYAAGGVALFAQPGSIEKLLNASNGTGLSERFLMSSEPHLLGKRKHVDAQHIDRAITAEYHDLATGIARVALNKDCTASDLAVLTISKNSHRKINQFRDGVEEHLADGAAYSVHQSLRGAAGKANIQIMKIAANLHLLDGGAYEPEIKDKHVESAIWIVNDVLKSMLGLCHDKELVGAKAEYSAITTYLSGKSKGATVNEMVNSLKRTKPFKDMTSGRNEAIRSAIVEMVANELLAFDNGIYSNK